VLWQYANMVSFSPRLAVLFAVSFCLGLLPLGRAEASEILVFDDFGGPASELVGHSPKQGNAVWSSPTNPAQALRLDGEGRALFDSESAPDGQRKFAWIDTGATGDEYYVAAECGIAGLGWGAVGFSGDNAQVQDPLLSAALFAVNGSGHWFLWIRDRNGPDSQPAFSGRLMPDADFRPPRPAVLSLHYNTNSGLLECYVNDRPIQSTTVSEPSLPIGRAVLAYHVDVGSDAASSLYTERFLVSAGKTELPSAASDQ
jgi:hypothetical protein